MAGARRGQVLNRRIFYAGDVLFREGDSGTLAYVVRSGRVRIVRELAGGERGTIGFIEPGGIFGEMALIDRSPRMATAIADETSECIAVPQETLTGKLKGADPELRMLITMLIRMVRTVTDDTPLPPDAVDRMADTAESAAANGARARARRAARGGGAGAGQ